MLQKVREAVKAFDVPTFIEKYCAEVEITDSNINEYIAICESKKILFMCDLVDFSSATTQDEIYFRIVEYNKILYLLNNGRMYIANNN